MAESLSQVFLGYPVIFWWEFYRQIRVFNTRPGGCDFSSRIDCFMGPFPFPCRHNSLITRKRQGYLFLYISKTLHKRPQFPDQYYLWPFSTLDVKQTIFKWLYAVGYQSMMTCMCNKLTFSKHPVSDIVLEANLMFKIKACTVTGTVE